MDPIVKSLWTDALRSGKYTQGRNTLKRFSVAYPTGHRRDEYCCLGVLCDLYALAHPDQPGWAPEKANMANSVPFSDLRKYEHDYLPTPVMEWAGLDLKNPHISINGECAHISSFNDGGGHTFNMLADAIDEQY